MTDPMTMNAYQFEVRRTALGNPLAPTTRERLINFALGLAGESGEVVDLIKKLHYHGKAVHTSDLVKELGDVLWYVAAMADALGLTLEQVAQINVDKLRLRFPDGFTAADANRKADEAPQRDPVAVGGYICERCMGGDHSFHSVSLAGIHVGCACGWRRLVPEAGHGVGDQLGGEDFPDPATIPPGSDPRPVMHLPAQMTELRERLEKLKTSIKGMAGHDYLAVAADNCLRLVPIAHDDNITAKERP